MPAFVLPLVKFVAIVLGLGWIASFLTGKALQNK